MGHGENTTDAQAAGGILGSIIKAAESATGLDIDGDGDVGEAEHRFHARGIAQQEGGQREAANEKPTDKPGGFLKSILGAAQSMTGLDVDGDGAIGQLGQGDETQAPDVKSGEHEHKHEHGHDDENGTGESHRHHGKGGKKADESKVGSESKSRHRSSKKLILGV